MSHAAVALLALALLVPQDTAEPSPFRQALAAAERALEVGDLVKARESVQRALERDRKSREAWALRARLAEKEGIVDERIYSLHQCYRLSVAQRADSRELQAERQNLFELDPLSKDLLGMSQLFLQRLVAVAQRYEKDKRPHAAISVHKTILALEPESLESAAAIERIASKPDPSLAGDAKPKDLFAGVSEEWIREHDAQHATWETRAKLERPNYITYTDAGYEVLVRAGEAMEQMNAFYREFFRYGTPEEKKSVPRIGLNLFKNRDEYLKLGIGPPVEWSGGHFTGDFVETYMGTGGFESMTGTLFHEAAHQFVSLATRAVGWLNEGLASFFEGTRILPNGTVIMNLPAVHRLFPLAARMEKGWMSSATDGADPRDPNATPDKAPTFRIVLENKYAWGPPWYAPTWGVVYFLYNYQDPFDGRFVYRRAFQEFIDKSGGRVGEGAVENFEEVVLGSPAPPIKGVERPKELAEVRLPKTAGELDAVWNDWMISLRDEQQGKLEVARPYRQWGRYAALSGDAGTAQEHFEKGLVEDPGDAELLLEFADLLAERLKNPDRASKLVLEAIRVLEERAVGAGSATKPEAAKSSEAIRAAERLLAKLDVKRETLAKLHEEMLSNARGLVQRYQASGLPRMVMDVSWRFGTLLNSPELFVFYDQALRESGKSLSIWELAYNELNLKGWDLPGTDSAFQPDGAVLQARYKDFDEQSFDYQVLTLDKTTSGDFSIEADVQAEKGKVNFCGFAFGRKDATSFHGLLLFPGKTVAAGGAESGFLDLMSSYGGEVKGWRHVPVQMKREGGGTSAEIWHTLRLDVSGCFVEQWFDGELLATHEFPSLDVLRGSFGLICGRGQARFKNIRYLARDPRDPAARLERGIRLEKLAASPIGELKSLIGRTPPWPRLAKWVQGERKSWDEKGNVPQLIVFFSIFQNDTVRIDKWLMDLAQRTKDYGLEFVCICSPNDEPRIEAYLKEHAFPGAVGVDFRDPKAVGIGETFELFLLRRFNLPRLLLVDLDQTVTWEGDPGFMAGIEWKSGESSFLDDSLQDLFEKRKLKALVAWKSKWGEIAVPALSRGELQAALPLLLESREFDRRFSPEAGTAQSRLGALETAVDSLEATAQALKREEAEPTLEVLLEWRALLGREVTPRLRAQLKAYLDGKTAKAWDDAQHQLVRFTNKLKKGEPPALADELLAGLEKLQGLFVRELAGELRAAREKNDFEAFARIVTEAESRPRLWLARSYFGG